MYSAIRKNFECLAISKCSFKSSFTSRHLLDTDKSTNHVLQLHPSLDLANSGKRFSTEALITINAKPLRRTIMAPLGAINRRFKNVATLGVKTFQVLEQKFLCIHLREEPFSQENFSVLMKFWIMDSTI
ncbi:hypothetical protein CDAR_616341 [Caerostris darwini]|uniref:Uncharacterized protein n=1 Tax=Caerostris darwini TaxID=1538125 RepID=A0AAV4WW41_9ARAC|nr:hypothetical protein CDAR_616341 [Caerostris darwini]